jgi:hypothetical protein
MELKDYQVITPKQFRDQFAPGLSLPAVRNLFNIEGFPAVKMGERYYTTPAAALAWLQTMGKRMGV